MIYVATKVIECAISWLSENYCLEVKEHKDGYGFTVKIKQFSKELSKW